MNEHLGHGGERRERPRAARTDPSEKRLLGARDPSAWRELTGERGPGAKSNFRRTRNVLKVSTHGRRSQKRLARARAQGREHFVPRSDGMLKIWSARGSEAPSHLRGA